MSDSRSDETGTADGVSGDQTDVAGRALAIDRPWRRLDARMVLVHPVGEVFRFLPALIGVFFIGNSLDSGGWWHVAAVAVPVVLGLLRYATTTFRITDEQLELRRGLLNRTAVTARLDRIRTVELSASPIHRVLRLAKVVIGTGSAPAGGSDQLKLDALPLAEARALRVALLHRSAIPERVGPDAEGAPDAGNPLGTRGSRDAGTDEVLLRLDPRWVRYAPLTTAGLVVAAAAVAATSQFSGPLVGRLLDSGGLDVALGGVPAWLAVITAAAAFAVTISVLALAGYLSTYWHFTLSRDRAGHSFHITRGMFTSRETSIETARVRGVEWHEPLGLRMVGAARLAVIVTGMTRREAGVATVAPPAPRTVVAGIGAAILGGAAHTDGPLTGHGPRAARRRYRRALTAAALIAAGWAAVVLMQGWNPWFVAGGALPVPPALLLARDRARRLGHALTERHLVTRAHSLRGRRDILLREGIIGWTFHQSFFQRRAGLVTLTATTAAGKQGYRVYDVPERAAVALADEAVPGILTPFLVGTGR